MTAPRPTSAVPAAPGARPCGCPDYDEARLALSRRLLLGTALAGGAVALGPSLTGAGPSAYAVTGRSAAGLAAPGGSVLVADNAAGYVWTFGPALIGTVVLAWPKLQSCPGRQSELTGSTK